MNTNAPIPLRDLLSEPTANPLITAIVYDSRRATEGALFVAIKGYASDGSNYIERAIEHGARAIVYDASANIAPLIKRYPSVVFSASPNPRATLASLAERFYQRPTQRIELLGVTGTNGKTTTTYLVKSILERVGRKTGLIGTIQNMIGDEVVPAERTTPEAPELEALFSEMLLKGARDAVMEASSHALALHRVDRLDFSAVIFTNLTEDHLDFHGTMEDYLRAKLVIFDILAKSAKKKKRAIVNIHTHGFDVIREKAQTLALPLVTFGFDKRADYQAVITEQSIKGTAYDLYYNGEKETSVRLALIGAFNALNSLGAIAYAHEIGIPFETALPALRFVQAPGRFEIVTDSDAPFVVAVDYAHTDDGIANALAAARALNPKRIISVFGCGGDRDRKKRPLMAKAAGERSDYAILTLDNPRTEPIEQIMRDTRPALIATGTPYEEIVDRNEAITRAVTLAEEGDIVIILGKGHETYQIFKNETVHFDDREAAREAVSKRFR